MPRVRRIRDNPPYLQTTSSAGFSRRSLKAPFLESCFLITPRGRSIRLPVRPAGSTGAGAMNRRYAPATVRRLLDGLLFLVVIQNLTQGLLSAGPGKMSAHLFLHV